MSRARFRDGLDEIWVVRRRDVIGLQSEARVRSFLDALREQEPAQFADLLDGARAAGGEEEAVLVDRLVGWFVQGDIQLVRIGEQARAPQTPRIDPGSADPRPPARMDPVERPTWISLEIVDEQGRALPDLGVAITFPEGTRRSGRLDETARFRADDVPEKGTCVVTTAAVPEARLPSGAARAVDGEWIGADGRDAVRLVTERHHRLVVVTGRTEIAVVDAVGEPAKGVFWQAVVAGKSLSGVTDETGTYVLRHPQAVEACEIELTKLDGSVWDRVE